MTNANDREIGGNHYKTMPIEHWDLVEIFKWDYHSARAIAYLMRWQDKGGIEDLEKAIHFIQKRIELEKIRTQNGSPVEVTMELLMNAYKKLERSAKENEEVEAEERVDFSLHSGAHTPVRKPPPDIYKDGRVVYRDAPDDESIHERARHEFKDFAETLKSGARSVDLQPIPPPAPRPDIYGGKRP
jgi:hypothetical protein